MSTTADIEMLRVRARGLRQVARRIGASPALTVHRLAGPETWVGPTAQSCLDELLAMRRRLESNQHTLDDAARRLDRYADELQRLTAAGVPS